MNERGGAAGRGRGGNFNVLGTDPAIWKFQVPGFLRPQSLTEWPNCHKSNSKLITTKITEAFCERHCRPEPGEPRAGAYHSQAELRERIRALRVGVPSPPGSERRSGPDATASLSFPPARSPGSPQPNNLALPDQAVASFLLGEAVRSTAVCPQHIIVIVAPSAA